MELVSAAEKWLETTDVKSMVPFSYAPWISPETRSMLVSLGRVKIGTNIIWTLW